MAVTIDAQFPNPELPKEGQIFYSKIAGCRWEFDGLEEALQFMRTTIDNDSDITGMQLTWMRKGA